MAGTSYAFTDPRAQKVWAPDLFLYALQNSRMSMLMGKTPDSIIHVNTDLTARPGGTVIFELKDPLSSGGVGDDGDTTNNEEAMTIGNMSLVVHERAHAVKSAGMMSEQLTSIRKVEGFRKDAKYRLGQWIKDKVLEDDLITCAAGLYNENSGGSAIQTINESYPATDRIWYGGQSCGSTPALGNSGVSYATDALLTAGTQANNLFGTLVISKVRSLALEAAPRFTPGVFRQPSSSAEKDIRFDTMKPVVGNFFVILVHPGQRDTMRSEVGTNGWAQLTALCRAQSDNHPVFTGGNVLWDGCIVAEYDRIPKRTGAGGTTLAEGFLLNAGRTATTDACANARKVCRALLLGAQGLCFGWAAYPGWFEDYVDCNKLKVKTDMIFGVAKTKFNAHGTETPGSEHAVYAIDTEVY